MEILQQSHGEGKGKIRKQRAMRKPGELFLDNPFWSFDTRGPENKDGGWGVGEGVKTAGLKPEQWTGLIQKNHSGHPLKTSEQAGA